MMGGKLSNHGGKKSSIVLSSDTSSQSPEWCVEIIILYVKKLLCKNNSRDYTEDDEEVAELRLACSLFSTGFLLVQLFDPEDEGSMFLRNVKFFFFFSK
jgi:hypothetical protein